MGKRGRKISPFFAALMTGVGFCIAGPPGALAVASAAFTGYRLGRKNASAKEAVGTAALSGLTYGIGQIAKTTDPVLLKCLRERK